MSDSADKYRPKPSVAGAHPRNVARGLRHIAGKLYDYFILVARAAKESSEGD